MALKPVRFSIVGQDKTAAAFGSVQKKMGGLQRSVKSLGGLIGVAFGAKAIRDQLNYADSIGKTARQLGGTAEFLSEAAAAAKLAGIETRTLTTGFQRMTRRVAEAAAGSSEFGKAFEALGLNARTLRGLNLEGQFTRIQEALAQVNNESERVRLAQKIFDSEGVVIARLAGQFTNLRNQAKAAGSTITTAFSEQAALINDQVTLAVERLNNGLRKSVSFVFQFAEGLAIATARSLGFKDGPIEQFGQLIEQAENRLVDLNAQLDVIASRPPSAYGAAAAKATRDEIDRLTKALAEYRRDLDELVSTGSRLKPSPTGAYEPPLAAGDKNRVHGLFATQVRRAFLASTSGFDETAQKAEQTADDIEKSLDDLNKKGRKTGSDLENSFASWLENTEGGFAGLAEAFSRTLRRMVAEAIASKLFELIIPFGKGTPFGGGKAAGGAVAAGTGYLVGERGPEFFIPNQSGKIIPNGAGGGGVNVVNNIDARGADSGLIAALPAILEQNREITTAEITRLIRQRRIIV